MPKSSELRGFLAEQGYTSLALSRTAIGQLQLDAVINERPARMILDTGASGTVIDTASAEGFGLHGEVSTEAVGCNWSSAASQVTIDRFTLDGIALNDFEVALVDLSSVNQALKQHIGSRVDGVLGTDVLERGEAIIDVAEGLLHMRL